MDKKPNNVPGIPKGTYSDWRQPICEPDGLYNLDEVVFPQNDPGPNQAIFYAHQVGFINGNGGYIGIQTDCNGKRAIFSIWDALASRGPAISRPFGGEGTGQQTMLPFVWEPGRQYRCRIWRLETDATGTWWGGWIIDESLCAENFVGAIKVPSAWKGLRGDSITWVEYYGPPASDCKSLPYSDVLFGHPTGNNGSSVAGQPKNHLSTQGNCPGRFAIVENWVRHENGWMGETSC